MNTLDTRPHAGRDLAAHREDRDRRYAESRQYLTEAPPCSTELAEGPLQALVELYDDARDIGEVWAFLVDQHEFNGLSDAELAAARAHLALHHAHADLLAHAAQSLVSGRGNPAPALRECLYRLLGTEKLSHAIHAAEHERAIEVRRAS